MKMLGIRGHGIRLGAKLTATRVRTLWNRGLEKEAWKMSIVDRVLIMAHTEDTDPSAEDVKEQCSQNCS